MRVEPSRWDCCSYKRRAFSPLSLSFSLRLCTTQGHPKDQELGRHQEVHLQMPCSWTSKTTELWEILMCCLSHSIYGILLWQPEQTNIPYEVVMKIKWVDLRRHLVKFQDMLATICIQQFFFIYLKNYVFNLGFTEILRGVFHKNSPDSTSKLCPPCHPGTETKADTNVVPNLCDLSWVSGSLPRSFSLAAGWDDTSTFLGGDCKVMDPCLEVLLTGLTVLSASTITAWPAAEMLRASALLGSLNFLWSCRWW